MKAKHFNTREKYPQNRSCKSYFVVEVNTVLCDTHYHLTSNPDCSSPPLWLLHPCYYRSYLCAKKPAKFLFFLLCSCIYNLTVSTMSLEGSKSADNGSTNFSGSERKPKIFDGTLKLGILQGPWGSRAQISNKFNNWAEMEHGTTIQSYFNLPPQSQKPNKVWLISED